MQRVIAAALAVGILAVHATAAPERLRQDWLRNDLEGIAAFLRLGPLERYRPEVLREQLLQQPAAYGWEEEEIGFGATHVEMARGFGYASIHVEAIMFRDELALYEITLDGSSDTWKRLRDQYAGAWAAAGGPAFEEVDTQFVVKKVVGSVEAAFKAAVATELGPMRPVKVPESFREEYDNLVSPLSNPSISRGPVGYGGQPSGRLEALEALIADGKTDVVENVLRGYSPGGRVHAAIALLSAKKCGLTLSSVTEETIRKVASLDAAVSTQSGCIVHSGRRAAAVIDEYVDEPDPEELSERPAETEPAENVDEPSGPT
jgi:hypothetical protein